MLVIQALRRAVEALQHGVGLLFHSDQGVQYQSRAYRHHLATGQIGSKYEPERQLLGQMPRWNGCSGASRPNGIPSWGYGTFQEGSQDIDAYLMGYYNQEGLHSYNNYVTTERQE